MRHLPALIRLAMALFATAVGILLLWLATLKESKDFWTYTSPFPVWFRDLVEVGFYPFLGVESIAFISLTAVLIYDLYRKRFHTLPSVGLMMINWLIYLTTVWIVIRDNI